MSKLKTIKMTRIILIIIFLLFYFASSVFASSNIVINEFSSASNPEWIELYNPGTEAVPLKELSLYLDATVNTSQKYTFCDNDMFLANSYKLITRPSNSYWLSNDGDSLILKNGDDVIDSIVYGKGQSLAAPSATQSATRNPDGSSNWLISNSPGPQGDQVSFVCPTLTPIPTSSPIPTSTPTPKPTSTPKLTSIPTANSPSLTPIHSPTTITSQSQKENLTGPSLILKAEIASSEGIVAGEATEQSEATPSSKVNFLPKILLIGIGLALLGSFASVFLIRNKGEVNQETE